MQLTPIAQDDLACAFDHLAHVLAPRPVARAAIGRIADTIGLIRAGYDLPEHRVAAVGLARSFGIETLDEPPPAAVSWDGRRIRTRSEASVILHEIAHWQICPGDRQRLPDFGLGAGPETGDKAAADAAAATGFATRQREETLASMLGILWEAALVQPAVLAFAEQNWLEGWQRPGTAAAIEAAVTALHDAGLVGDDGCPSAPVEALSRVGSVA